MKRSGAEAVREARDYYDQTTTLYLSHLGATLQAGIARAPRGEPDAEAYRRHNLFLASRAAVRGGERVLDAGCGVCGPAADLADRYADLHLFGVTVSGVQARVARRRLRQRGLGGRVHVAVADFHRLPVADGSFDLVTFHESAGYSHDRESLFAEAARVLRPGGRLYVKDVFRRDGPLPEEERRQLAAFNAAFVYDTAALAEVVSAVAGAGLEVSRTADLSEALETRRFLKAMVETHDPEPRLTAFGQRHAGRFDRLPVYFGDLLAFRPPRCGPGA